MSSSQQQKPKKRVLVVGAGAAGMACASQLSQSPDFDVTLVDAVDYCGGQAFAIPIDEKKHGAPWMNQGVQGGSHIYHHTFKFMKDQGFESSPVDLQVSFGKGNNFWTNVFATKLQEEHASEIRRFKWALKIMRWFEILFAVIPINVSLTLFGFSKAFKTRMIYPSLALFLGTGQATPYLPTIIMERMWTSPTYGMFFPADEKALVGNEPPMVVFPNMSEFYEKWRVDLESRGVKVRLSTEVTRVIKRNSTGVRVGVKSRRVADDHHNPGGETDPPVDQDMPETIEDYDELVLCTIAETAKRLLGSQARWIEKRVLGATKWSDDITVTHTDHEYFKRHLQTDFAPDVALTSLGGRDESARYEKGKSSFKPMYLIKVYDEEPEKLEMAFDCSNFQAQLSEKNLPFERHVFQSIMLNTNDKEKWTRDEIDPAKIIREDWWRAVVHSWTHYVLVVPWMFLLNSARKHTHYAGSYTVVNAHEVAVISGVATAYALGAPYPEDLENDSFALLCFRLLLFLQHGRFYRKGSNRASVGSGKRD